jgi:glutamate:GABA antiporter
LATEKLKRALGHRDLILFYVVSGLSLRWIATAAATGPSALGVWLLAWCGFFLPLAGCVLELSSRYPAEGGLYVWTREAFGPFPAFLSAWTYWMSNLPYFPAVLFFAAGSLLYARPDLEHLADSHAYYMIFTVAALLLITTLNVVGLGTGKWLNNVGALGMALPVVLLIALGATSLARFGSATHFTLGGLMPHAGIKNLIFLSTIFFAFGGCEAASFMGDEINDARRTIPKSLLVAGAIVTVGYMAGTAAMLIALPASSISGLGGFMTAIDFLACKLGVIVLVAPIAVLVTIGNIGAASAYLAAAARLPFVAGVDRYLPPAFGRVHPRWRTPYIALIWYGAAGIFFGLLGEAGTSVKGAYDMLVSMGVITYFIPYLFLFASMIRLQSRPSPAGAIRLPGGKWTAIPLASIGLFSTICTIVLSLFPAEDDANPTATLTKILVMTLLLIGLGVAIYLYSRKSLRSSALEADSGCIAHERSNEEG